MNNSKESEERKSSENENDHLTLSLSYHAASPPPTQRLIFPHTSPQSPFQTPPLFVASPAPTNPMPADVPESSSSRRPVRQTGKSDTIPPPFPWATNHRATVHTLRYLLQNQIFTVNGHVKCKRCQHEFEIEFDLKERFAHVWSFVAEHRSNMHDRAPSVWMNPTLPTCKRCGQENTAKPVIAKKKKSIDWLFLFLGQMLGCCTLEQLKYFCKHTNNHRTGAKDRVLYLTYLQLCKQLDPDGPFHR